MSRDFTLASGVERVSPIDPRHGTKFRLAIRIRNNRRLRNIFTGYMSGLLVVKGRIG